MLRGKRVYLNADTTESAFWVYLYDRFQDFQLRSLTCTHFVRGGIGEKTTFDGEKTTTEPLNGDGDCLSKECLDILQENDVLITNPPFSLLQDIVPKVIEYGKDMIILCNKTSFIYKGIFEHLMANRIFSGVSIHTGTTSFFVPEENGEVSLSVARWMTTFPIWNAPHLVLTETYSPENYNKFDNYDAICVNSVKEIPKDYEGKMGVPITFIDKWNREDFEILDYIGRYSVMDLCGTNETIRQKRALATDVKGKSKFSRLIIQKRLDIR